MQFVRHSPLARAIALLILLWTAVDLADPSACALDLSLTHSAAIQASNGVGTPIGGTPATPIDDCFCCSHCVRPSAMAVPTVWRPVVVRRAFQHNDRLISADLGSVYHPPQVRS